MSSLVRVASLLLISILSLFIFSCEDTSIVGSGLLEEEELSIFYTEDIELIAKTISVDTYQVFFNQELSNESNLIGQLEDPFFGVSKSSIYTEVHLQPGNETQEFNGGIIDSLILVLAYDTIAMYGDLEEPFDIKVHRLTESMFGLDELYSDAAFDFESTPIAELSGIIPSYDSMLVFNPRLDTTELRAPALRITLPTRNGIGTELFNDTLSAVDDIALNSLIPGFYIETDRVQNRLIGFNMFNPTSSFVESKLELYYRNNAGDKKVYEYGVPGIFIDPDADGSLRNSVRFTSVQNSRGNSVVEEFVNDEIKGDSLLFISGQLGYDIELDLKDALTLNEFALNKAELEFTIANLDGDDLIAFPPVQELYVSRIDEDGNLAVIDDLQLGVLNSDIPGFFGGNIAQVEEDGVMLQRYTMSITSHLQQIFSGTYDSKIIVTIKLRDNLNETLSFRNITANRSIIYGPGHSKYPAKLKITYTAP